MIAHQGESMKLYGFPASPNTWKVRALAAHLGLALEDKFIDLSKGEQRQPEYLKVNPTGRTPTLVNGDFTLPESNAIMQYLASRRPNRLWPSDERARTDIARWQFWSVAHWSGEACVPLIFQKMVKAFLGMGAPDETVVAKGTEAFHREATILDAHLGRHGVLVGDDLTVADFTVVAPLVYAKEAGLPVVQYPHVQAWSSRILALPAWQDTAPQRPATART